MIKKKKFQTPPLLPGLDLPCDLFLIPLNSLEKGQKLILLSSTAQKHAADFEAIGKERHLEQLAEKKENANKVWAEKTQEWLSEKYKVFPSKVGIATLFFFFLDDLKVA